MEERLRRSQSAAQRLEDEKSKYIVLKVSVIIC